MALFPSYWLKPECDAISQFILAVFELFLEHFAAVYVLICGVYVRFDTFWHNF